MFPLEVKTDYFMLRHYFSYARWYADSDFDVLFALLLTKIRSM